MPLVAEHLKLLAAFVVAETLLLKARYRQITTGFGFDLHMEDYMAEKAQEFPTTVKAEVDGTTYTGAYRRDGNLIDVQYEGRVGSTQIGGSLPDDVARLVLIGLVRNGRAKAAMPG